MKKKGLIVATIVMVLVLAVSLTTATYAWFSTSDVTKIDAFEVKVVSNNAVNIGVKAECVHELSVIDDDFYTGTVEYQHGADGVLGGSWDGTVTGLSSTINHNINWETQKKAVGVVAVANSDSTVATEYGTLEDKYSLHTDGSALYTMNAANKGEESALVNVTRAKANYTPDGENTKPGDYVYLFLGASPTKKLTTNQLIIMIDGTKSPGQNVGILASIHVAYRITKAGASQVTTDWTEVDVFAQDGETNKYHYNDKLANVHNNLSTEQLETYKVTYDVDTAPTSKAFALVIDGLSLDKDAIDQIELVIYMCGSDGDCIDAGLGTGGNISIFFHTVTDTSATE